MFVSQEPTADSDSEGGAASDRRDKMHVRGGLFALCWRASAVLLLMFNRGGEPDCSEAPGPPGCSAASAA